MGPHQGSGARYEPVPPGGRHAAREDVAGPELGDGDARVPGAAPSKAQEDGRRVSPARRSPWTVGSSSTPTSWCTAVTRPRVTSNGGPAHGCRISGRLDRV